MRLSFIAVAVLCLATGPSPAATIGPLSIDSGASDLVEVRAPHCGRHAHYAAAHRSRRDGHWISGRCVRNSSVVGPVDHSCHARGGFSTGSGCERGDHRRRG